MAQSVVTTATHEVAPRLPPRPGSAGHVPPALRWALRLPILYKVLVANAAVVVLGAVAGTWLTVLATRADEAAVPLVFAFVLLGVVLSVVVNWLVLRAAFRPLTSLERVAEAVRLGDLSARAEPTPFADPQVAHLAATFNGTLDELERDRAELRSVASQVINAQEEERKRISRELHDDTAQVLFAQLLRLTALKASPNAEVRGTAATLEEMTAEALEGVRRMAMELRPPALDDLGLQATLADLAQRFSEQLGIPIDYQPRGPRGRLPAEVELVLYRVAQEALTNVAKHAGAGRVWIDLDRGPHDVTLSVQDDGRGFEPAEETRRDGRGLGLGLFGMAERVALVGGNFTIWSRPGRGTEI
ncbi:MAG: HAMP domain-containing sensor histidine kinase, partial [Chloroflexota bacterium]|nr:HAMP domain-containing sensor histidine kinase [Chloroflexota bacterium]